MNLLQVNILGYGTRTVEVDDFYAVVESRPDLFSGISPIVSMTGTVKVGTKTYRRTSVSGVSESYFGMSGASIAQGRLLQYVDCTNYKKVCVVGDYVNRVAYGGNALGQTIKVGADQFTIVGVLKAEVKDPSLQQGSADDYIYLPYTTALRLNRSSVVGSYGITTVSETQVSEGKAVLEAALKKLLNSDEGFYVTSLSEMLATLGSMINMVVMVPDGHRSHLAAGGRHRHYEHHDGVGGGTDPGNRDPEGAGSQGTVHSGPVRHRSRHHVGSGGPDRQFAGLSDFGRRQPDYDHHQSRYDHPAFRGICDGSLRHLGGASASCSAICRPSAPPRLNPIEALRYD